MSHTYNVPIYQVDFNTNSKGKKLGMTKRLVRWSFGFACPDALNRNLGGVECRGEEHELVLVWSITSGKHRILLDGDEIHHSVTPRLKPNTRIEFSFKMPGTMDCYVRVTAQLGIGMWSASHGVVNRKYDLMFNGLSFFDLPKVFQLERGMAASALVQISSPAAHVKNYQTPIKTPVPKRYSCPSQEVLNLHKALNADDGMSNLFMASPVPSLVSSDASGRSWDSPSSYSRS